MTIRVLCDPSENGAFADLYWTKQVRSYRPGDVIYVREFAQGATVALREMNGYDDSDFYATYYDADEKTFREVMYGSTRGWTYPSGATIDATPEVLALWDEHRREIARQRAERAAAIEATTPRKGKRVRIIAKRGKAARLNGREGVVFWIQEQRSQYGTWSYGTRLGVEVDGERVFVNATGVEVASAS